MVIEKDLEKVKEIFLSDDLDGDTRNDNLEILNKWEQDLRDNEDFSSWQESDISKSIVQKAKEAYKDNAMRLMVDRDLTEAQRQSLWAKQDASLWLLSILVRDTKSAVSQIHKEIRMALKAE